MIAKILSLTIVYFVAILVAPCDDLDKCHNYVDDTCTIWIPLDCTPPQCQQGNDVCDAEQGCRPTTPVPDYPFTLCNDNSACTINDVCINGDCYGEPITCEEPCKTGGFCSEMTGQCIYDGAVECAPPTNPCMEAFCNLNTGACEERLMIDDTPCDDFDDCTMNDHCISGQCVTEPVTCNTPCMLNGACVAGLCVYDGTVQCTTSNPCKTADCNPLTGSCEESDLPNDSTCDDGDVCTNERCLNGQCEIVDVTCNEPCKRDGRCNPDTGVCDYTPVVCDEKPCMKGVCLATTGECSYTPLQNGSPCSDGNNCTMDSCVAGKCVSTPVNCTRVGSNPCQFNNGTCVPSTGKCAYANKPEGTGCDDGNLCTIKDKCTAGQCKGTNNCCLGTKNKCGICVRDCCTDYSKVLQFFGLRGGESDVTQVSGGGCSGSTVCCAPISQSIFTYQSDRCMVTKTY